MPTETRVTRELVAEIADGMVVKGLKPTVDSVWGITKGRRDYVRRHLKTWRDLKRKEHETLLSSTINERLAKAILVDREAHTREQTALLQEQNDNLEDDCTSLERCIAELHTENEALNKLLTTERATTENRIKELEQGIAVLGERFKAKDAQASALSAKLEVAAEQIDKANTDIAALSKDLGHWTSEATREKTRADDLLRQLEAASDELNQAKSQSLVSTKDVEHLHAEVTRLEKQAELLQTKLDEQSQGRIEALQGAIKTLQAGKTQKGGARSATAKPTESKATSTSAPA